MPRIHHPSQHPPVTHHAPHQDNAPSPDGTTRTAPAQPEDSFVPTTLRQVYESQPLVMMCTKPDLRALVSKIPIVKEIADAVCPLVTGEETGATSERP